MEGVLTVHLTPFMKILDERAKPYPNFMKRKIIIEKQASTVLAPPGVKCS